MLILFESITGYSLFSFKEEFTHSLIQGDFQNQINNYEIFFQNFKLKAFAPFRSINHALKESCRICRSLASEYLQKFILNSFYLYGDQIELGVTDARLAIHINKTIKKKVTTNDEILEFSRGIRLHFEKISGDFFYRDICKAQLGVAHLYSQSKMKLNLEKTDSLVTQSNFLLEQLDSDLNFFTMLCKDWYTWHFPELIKTVKDGYLFALVVKLIGNRKSLNKKKTEELKILIINEFVSEEIINSSRISIGSNISTSDVSVIERLASLIINLSEFRNYINFSLCKKVATITPNLNQIIGENLVAKLISKAGSLKNLTRFPASTIQILGSEKALFKALKNKIKTPKYGILFHSNFLQSVEKGFQAKFSRYLANKCTLAIRIDYFSNFSTKIYGESFNRQLKNKLLNIPKRN
jgi:nucleolar protein 56